MSVYPHLVLNSGFNLYQGTTGLNPHYFQRERDEWFKGINNDSNSLFNDFVTEYFINRKMMEELQMLLRQHGIFHFSHFRRKVFTQVSKRYIELGTNHNSIKNLVGKLKKRHGMNMSRDYYIKDDDYAIFEIFNHIYEQGITSLISDNTTLIQKIPGSLK